LLKRASPSLSEPPRSTLTDPRATRLLPCAAARIARDGEYPQLVRTNQPRGCVRCELGQGARSKHHSTRCEYSPARSSLVPPTRLTHHTSYITHRRGAPGRMNRHDRRGALCSSRRVRPPSLAPSTRARADATDLAPPCSLDEREDVDGAAREAEEADGRRRADAAGPRERGRRAVLPRGAEGAHGQGDRAMWLHNGVRLGVAMER